MHLDDLTYNAIVNPQYKGWYQEQLAKGTAAGVDKTAEDAVKFDQALRSAEQSLTNLSSQAIDPLIKKLTEWTAALDAWMNKHPKEAAAIADTAGKALPSVIGGGMGRTAGLWLGWALGFGGGLLVSPGSSRGRRLRNSWTTSPVRTTQRPRPEARGFGGGCTGSWAALSAAHCSRASSALIRRARQRSRTGQAERLLPRHRTSTGRRFPTRTPCRFGLWKTRLMVSGGGGDYYGPGGGGRGGLMDRLRGRGAGGGSPSGSGPPGKTSDAMAYAMDQLRKEGVPEAHLRNAAAVLVGEAIAESGLRPGQVHDHGTGYGIYRARLGRRDKMAPEWLAANGYAKDFLEGQLDIWRTRR